MKKKDIILIVLVLLLAGGLFLWRQMVGAKEGAAVRVTVNGEVYGVYSLLEPQDIVIDTELGHNLLQIRDGKAVMAEADCPDGYCRQQSGIRHNHQTIVCLPHKVVAEVVGGGTSTDEQMPDVVAK